MTPRHRISLRKVRPFSTAWWWRQAQSLFWVCVVTVLVWIYADMEYTATANLPITLQLTTGKSQRMTLLSQDKHILSEEERRSMSFEVSGSRSALEELRRKLQGRGSVIRFDVSQDYTPDHPVVRSEELLKRALKADGISLTGISVVNVSPAVVDMRLDNLVRLPNVQVELDAQGVRIPVPPQPQKVDVLVPESQMETVQPAGSQPVLHTKPKDLKGLPTGEPVEVRADIHPWIAGVMVRPMVSEATFTVRIESNLEPREFQVPVQVLAPPEWSEGDEATWQQYVLVTNPSNDWRPKLTVIGPAKDLNAANIRAFITLSDDDKLPTDSWLKRTVTVSFAPGTDLKLQGPPPEVQFRLEKRESAGP